MQIMYAVLRPLCMTESGEEPRGAFVIELCRDKVVR